jgi:hypothetical protein
LETDAAIRSSILNVNGNKLKTFGSVAEQMTNLLAMIEYERNVQSMLMICFDFQWADLSSWEVVHEVCNTSHNTFFAIFISNNVEFLDSKIKFMSDTIKNAASTVVLPIAPLSCVALRNMTQSIVGSSLDVPYHILRTISKQVEGNHVYAYDTVLGMFGDRLHTLDNICKDPLELFPEDLVPRSFNSKTLAQMDKLNQQFQVILRVGSILGTYFSLEDVLKFGNIELELNIMAEKILFWDRYNYLVVDTLIPYFYTFKSSLVRNSIYNLILLTDRIKMHSHIAEELNKNISNNECVDVMLPIVYYHCIRTNDSQRKFEIMETLAQAYMKIVNYSSSLYYYRKLQQYGHTEEGQNYLEKTDSKLKMVVWIRKEADILFKSENIDESVIKYREALNLLQVGALSHKKWVHRRWKKYFTRKLTKLMKTDLYKFENNMILKSYMLALLNSKKKLELQNILIHVLKIETPLLELICVVAYVATMGGFPKFARIATSTADDAIKNAIFSPNAKKYISLDVKIECLEYLVQVKFSALNCATFLDYSNKLSELLTSSLSTDKLLNSALLSTTIWVLCGRLDNLYTAYLQFKSCKPQNRSDNFDRWENLVQVQLFLPKGSFDEAQKIIGLVDKSIVSSNPGLLEPAQILLVDSIQLYIQCMTKPRDVILSEKLGNSTLNMSLGLGKNNFKLIMPIFYNLRAILRLMKMEFELCRDSKDVIKEYIIQVELILNALQINRVAASLWQIHKFIRLKMEDYNDIEAYRELYRGYGLNSGDESLHYIDGIIMSIMCTLASDKQKLIKNFTKKDPLAVARRHFDWIGASFEIDLLNVREEIGHGIDDLASLMRQGSKKASQSYTSEYSLNNRKKERLITSDGFGKLSISSVCSNISAEQITNDFPPASSEICETSSPLTISRVKRNAVGPSNLARKAILNNARQSSASAADADVPVLRKI